jgi:hypothetical protein
VERLLREHAAFRHLPAWLQQLGDAPPAAGEGRSARFAAVYTPQQADEVEQHSSAHGGMAEHATPRSLARPSLASALSTTHAALPSPDMEDGEEEEEEEDEGKVERENTDAPAAGAGSGGSARGEGDVEAPVMARERQRARRREEPRDKARRIGGKGQLAAEGGGVGGAAVGAGEGGRSKQEDRERARGLVELGNADISSGDFAAAAARFEQAHLVGPVYVSVLSFLPACLPAPRTAM